MLSAEAHRDEFIKLVDTGDEDKCIEYINKYNDFYDTIYDKWTSWGITKINILMHTCWRRLPKVAIALIGKKCNLTYHDDSRGYSALTVASINQLHDVVAHIIDNLSDTTTRFYSTGSAISEMMYLCLNGNNNANIIKMINKGYDIYYHSPYSKSVTLFTTAVRYGNMDMAKKLIDIDIDFAEKIKIYYGEHKIDDNFYNRIVKYINDKRDAYKHTIIATMDDASPANALYQSFHTTYAVGLVDIICDFILLQT
ncbi:MAG: hypothetical protein Faunusvirus25_7 [Faunusvirus sp.]|jgi:hypothetical protein|uniref:Ankyrin repeat protein n=1 Tax=Faunusvirus sp. TaxID=2487766 RepID=A0A3G5A278_9VIRU|nr:MAG: hypothetical protein Faunusvirus25_7 [Faunusvirus sp.]